MDNFEKVISEMKSREDFISFINLMIDDLNNNRGSWSNIDLLSYLNAIASWTEDMHGYYEYKNQQLPNNISWSVFANILIAAKMYE